MRQTLATLVLVGALGAPSQSLAQHPAWVTQLEVLLGGRCPFNEVTQVVIDGGSASGVELKSSLAYGGRVLFPLANAPTPHLGKVFFGLEGLGSFGVDMKLANTDAVVGKAHYYHAGIIIGMGKFVTDTSGNLTLHGALGVGVAHTSFSPNDGVAVVEDKNSATALLANATLGTDISLGRAMSVVTSASLNLGFRDPLDTSLVLLGGLALRLPTSGGPGY